MPPVRTIAVINGYGVPGDIRTDCSYHAYLVQVLNWLWGRHRTRTLTIVPCGGKTDMWPPYRRTEAGEMAKWLRPRMRALGLSTHWGITSIATELTALENMLAVAKRYPKGPMVYFCEWTRLKKMRTLAKRIFGKRCLVVGIEFDGSAPRYDLNGRRALEHEDLQYSLAALEDPTWRRMLRAAADEKIRVLRATPEHIRATEVDRIARRIRREFRTRYERSRHTR
ncbi:MAG: hypothetical protein Q7R80_05170 [bacterium]|nr:hypothetical protein [bacterium]